MDNLFWVKGEYNVSRRHNELQLSATDYFDDWHIMPINKQHWVERKGAVLIPVKRGKN
jgi:hypothetical protein